MEGAVAGETIAEEPLAERSTNEKGTVNKKIRWLTIVKWLEVDVFFPFQ